MKYLYQFVFFLIREKRLWEAGFGTRVREALLGKPCSLRLHQASIDKLVWLCSASPQGICTQPC